MYRPARRYPLWEAKIHSDRDDLHSCTNLYWWRSNNCHSIFFIGTWSELWKYSHYCSWNWHWRRSVSRWIPHLLLDDQKKERVQTCMLWMALFEPNGPKLFLDVATGDECWISFFTNNTKQSNMVWLNEDDPRPQILNTAFRSHKWMFTICFNWLDPIWVDIMPQDSTITAKYYTYAVFP